MPIAKDTYSKGFRLSHFGTILHARMHAAFGKIVDKVQVTLITDEAKMKALMPDAKVAYAERDERVAGMSGEGGAERVRLPEIQPQRRKRQRLLHHGRPYDLLRVLRVHSRHGARGQRVHD